VCKRHTQDRDFSHILPYSFVLWPLLKEGAEKCSNLGAHDEEHPVNLYSW
jgi:hypothetical protein